MSTILDVDQLTVRFDGVTAVDQVSLKVELGDRWAVIGPNGAGKTTLFRTVSGEIYPTEGHIYLFGDDMSRAAAYRKARRGVGRTYQITNLFRQLTVEENVTIAVQATSAVRHRFWWPVRVRGDLEARIAASLEMVGLSRHRQMRVGEMSHGEQRQLEIAMALASNPKLLLLDEPAAGLSAAERMKMKDLLRGLPRELSVVLIEHDMDIALDIVDRVLVLHNGRVIAEGAPEEIRNNDEVQDVYLRSD